MQKTNKIFALCLSLIMVILSVGGMTVSADASIDAAAYFSAKDNGFIIEGTITGSDADDVTIFVYKPGYKIEDVEAGTKSITDALSNATTERVSGGKFSYTCAVKSTDVTGYYTVYINYGGEDLEVLEDVYYAIPTDAEAALGRINAISETYDTAEDKVTAFNEELPFLGKLPAMYGMLSDEQRESVIGTITEKTDYASLEDVKVALDEEALSIVILDPADTDMLEFAIDNYNNVIGIDLENPFYKKYVKDYQDRVEKVYEYVLSKAPFETVDVIKDEFQRGVIVQTLNNISSKGEIYNNTTNVISVVADQYNVSLLDGLNMSGFYNLTEPRQEAMLTDFYKNKKHKVASCEDFVTAWNTAVKNAPSLPLGNGGGGGGGGGGGPIVNDPSSITEGGEAVSGISGVTNSDDEETNNVVVFNDLAGFEWAEDSIIGLYKAGIVNGKTETGFAPNDNITREEFLKMLYLCANLKVDENAQSTFIDVNPGEWYYGIIASAQAQGLVNGVSNVHFGVGQNITRQDMSVMIVRMISSLGVDLNLSTNDAKFVDDANIASYANVSVYTMKRAGIINGYEDGSFKPESYATRAEAAKIIYALCSLMID